MNIRRYKKDHLKELAPVLSAVPPPGLDLSSESDDRLKFWTRHKNPFLVDLTIYATGNLNALATRGRSFSGRLELIMEMLPAIQALCEYSAPRSIAHHHQALRSWWRLFDEVERAASETATDIVRRVSDIGEVHRSRALDQNMPYSSFAIVHSIINIIRNTQGLRSLHWRRPAKNTQERRLPPEWQIKKIRIALKHAWFATLDRWQTADELLAGRDPRTKEERKLLRNYHFFEEVVTRTGEPRPWGNDIRAGMSKTSFNREGLSTVDMLKGRYPDAEDIRTAFHLCLASTGWNPAVFLSLDVNSAFLEPHPKDPTRYLLHGYKARGKTYQISEGLFKTQSSAGVILQTLQKRTEPLRSKLRLELAEQELKLQTLVETGATSDKLNAQRKVVARLRDGASSLWLYVVATNKNISWLDPHETTYSHLSLATGTKTYLDSVIARINIHQPADRQVSSLKPSDFRDAFAAYAYNLSGGMILYVMKALGHKRLRSTNTYLDNTLINEKTVQLYRNFSNALWTEIRDQQCLDPTLIAKWARDGNISSEQRERLASYRSLRRSRIGIGCKDPTNPPSHIAPGFRVDGKAMCHVHRCMLCPENAVIFPDSMFGLTKRLAELREIRSEMSTISFYQSSFSEEMENTELALRIFDPSLVAEQVSKWENSIKNKLHSVIDLNGQV